MAQSLSPQCTPLKHKYDSCFNAWFEGYLEPALSPSATAQQRQDHSKRKAQEFQEKCGAIWEEYRACVQAAVKERGLDRLLHSAREENPLKNPPPSQPSKEQTPTSTSR